MSLDDEKIASRRKFLKFLAASPLLAGSDLAAWAAEKPSLLPDPMLWGHRGLDRLIKTPKEAINVFDFEPVMFKNVPPAHFGYMASGIDDEMTLRANREGFQKFVLRPRRLVDVRKVDMSVDILGERYPTPIMLAPVGGHRMFAPEGELDTARGAKAGNHLPDPVDLDHGRRRGRHRRTRRADLVPALRLQQLGRRQGAGDARRKGRLPGGGGDRRPQRRPQPGDPVPAASRSTSAIATSATTARA